MKTTRSDIYRATFQTLFKKDSLGFAKIAPAEGDIGRKGKCTASVGMEGGELSWSYLLSSRQPYSTNLIVLQNW